MAQTEENLPTRRDMQADLHAAVRARQELGLDMEDHVLDSFLNRLEQRVDAMVDARIDQKHKVVPAKSGKVPPPNEGIILGTVGTSIPLMVIAAIFAGALGVGLVMAGVVGVILLYFVDRWATN
jgi:hypothetical protein